MDDVPPILGHAGLTGRQLIVRAPDVSEEGWDEPRGPAAAMPPNCLRVFNSPLPPERGGGCDPHCQGRQPDGGCLCDIVRAANAAGVQWMFDVRFDEHGNQFWTYDGDPIPGYEVVRFDVGRPEGRWQPGSEPGDLYEYAPVEPSSYVCPFCDHVNEQDPDNFNFWCATCGRNATDYAP